MSARNGLNNICIALCDYIPHADGDNDDGGCGGGSSGVGVGFQSNTFRPFSITTERPAAIVLQLDNEATLRRDSWNLFS